MIIIPCVYNIFSNTTDQSTVRFWTHNIYMYSTKPKLSYIIERLSYRYRLLPVPVEIHDVLYRYRYRFWTSEVVELQVQPVDLFSDKTFNIYDNL